jgi:hypothetical protein
MIYRGPKTLKKLSKPPKKYVFIGGQLAVKNTNKLLVGKFCDRLNRQKRKGWNLLAP